MPGIGQKVVGSCRVGFALLPLLFGSVGGCGSVSKGTSVFSPYRAASQPEEFRSPPTQDARYTEPPSYPSHLLKPIYKPKDNAPEDRRKAFGAGGAPGGAMGF